MSPQMKAMIAARIAETAVKRNTPEPVVIQSNTHASQAEAPQKPTQRLPDVQAAQGQRLQDPQAAVSGAVGKGDRYRLGQAAYMREYRAKQKAKP